MATRQSTRRKARPVTITAAALAAAERIATAPSRRQVIARRIGDLQERVYDILAACEIARRSVSADDDNSLFRVLYKMADDLEKVGNDLDPAAVLRVEAVQS
jgi:hypothetical protein